MPDVTPQWKLGPKAKPRKPTRARPDEPLRDRCEAQFAGCTGRATERHHVLPRSAGGSDDASNTRDICSADHAYIHAHPSWSYRMGWLLHRPLLAHKNGRGT